MKKILLYLLAIFFFSAIVSSQTLNVLHAFGNFKLNGAYPQNQVIKDGDVLYGTTPQGGAFGGGIIYKINSDGSDFTILYSFNAIANDASSPEASLTVSGSTLYGTTYGGGTNHYGTIFKINTDGSGYSILHSFSYSEGYWPYASLTLSGSTLYGTTYRGGTNRYGIIYKINTDGTGFSTLHSFSPSTEGYMPQASLTLSGSSLFGTTSVGGTNYYGTIFEINTDGTGFTVLHSFSNSDGSYPYSSLTLSGSTLYGTTYQGGTSNSGTIFKINTDGSDFSTLFSFSNKNDTYPYSSLTLSGSTLYGTTNQGGANNYGTVFEINTDGSGFSVLHSFSKTDGATPEAPLTLSGSTLYGTTQQGGTHNYGTIFKINTDGTAFSSLYSFYYADAYYPRASVILSGSTVYGTTESGGTYDYYGTIYKINSDGSGYSILHSFSQTDGAYPKGSLVLSGSTLYGTTYNGGTNGSGVIFSIDTNGTGYKTLYSFSNSDGANPYAQLILNGKTLYGTTVYGGTGPNGYGTIFKIDTDGTGFKILYSFSYSDGAYPYASLTLSDSTLYGTTDAGGTNVRGTIFKIQTDGTGFTNLYSFSGPDGANPFDALILSGSTLYGTTYYGGSNNYYGYGNIFKIDTNGTEFSSLHSFSNTDGANPFASLILSGSILYGSTGGGGTNGYGTIFKIDTTGTGFSTLHSFISSEGINLYASLILSGSTFYGTAYSGGMYNDGTIYSFTLRSDPPTITTNAISNISNQSANGGGNVTDDGGATVTARGVCWNTTGSPTTSDNHTTDGSRTGSFSSSIASLNPNTFYHVRAFATNSNGTSYGNEVTFTTLVNPPTCASVTNRDTTSATLNWTANSNNGSESFTYSANVWWCGIGCTFNATGIASSSTSYDIPLSSLPPETYCHYDMFGVNAGGTGTNSNTIDFWTLSREPKRHAGTFTATTVSATEIDLAFEAASNITDCDGYLLVQRTGSSPSWTPTKGQGYTAGTIFSGDKILAIITDPSATTYYVTGFSTGNHYYFMLIPFNWNGTNSETYNYHLSPTIPQADAEINLPSVSAESASDIVYHSVNVNGTVSSNGAGTTVKIDYGTSQDYGNTVYFDESPLAFSADGISLTKNISGLLSNTLYYYRISATNAAGTVTGGDSLFITEATSQDGPTVQDYCIKISNIRATSADISWTKGNGSGSMVIMKAGSAIVDNDLPVSFGTYPSFNNNFFRAPKIGSAKIVQYGPAHLCYISGLSGMSTYYIKIFGYYDDPSKGTARYNRNPATNNPINFRTPRAREGEDNLTSGDGFYLGNINPNPTKDKIEFSFTNPVEDMCTIEIYCDDGEKVMSYMENQLFGAGNHQLEINIGNLSSGSYTLVVRAGNDIAFSKFIILK